jgi:hypothetical protein
MLLLSDVGAQFSQIKSPNATVFERAWKVAAFGAARNVAWLQAKNTDSIGHLAALFKHCGHAAAFAPNAAVALAALTFAFTVPPMAKKRHARAQARARFALHIPHVR